MVFSFSKKKGDVEVGAIVVFEVSREVKEYQFKQRTFSESSKMFTKGSCLITSKEDEEIKMNLT